MASSLLRTSLRATTRTAASAIKPAAAGLAGTSFVRTNATATLPDLPYDYSALEPHISARIMELHHSAHHKTYVNGFNTALEQISEAQAAKDMAKASSLAPLLNFHGGGHLNHSLFWENLSPPSSRGGKGGEEPTSGALFTKIDETFGGVDALKKKMNAALAGIQGSGWAWLIQDGEKGGLSVVTRANQDPVVGAQVPLLGIDAWEHAYYLQYENRKVEYFNAIWNVVNWETVGRRLK